MNKLPNYHIAVPTSFDENEELNVDATLKHIQYLHDKNIKSVLVCASTGEQHSLTLAEKIKLLNGVSKLKLDSDFSIIFGIASIRQKEAVELAKKVRNVEQVSAIMLGFSPYVLPNQKEAINYAEAIIKAANRPTIIYDNPLRTGFDLSVESFKYLVDRNDLIIGLKEAGNPKKVAELKNNINKPLYYFAGGEKGLADKVQQGYNSLSSIAGNLYPHEIENWFNSLLNNEDANYDQLMEKINEVFTISPLPFIKSNISKNENINFGICRTPLGN